jgi:hypothetical protein
MHVVQQPDLGGAQLLPKKLDPVRLESRDEHLGKLLRAHVPHDKAGLPALNLMGDCMHQVRLADTRSAVKEKRVVHAARIRRHVLRARESQPVAGTDHERVEPEPGIGLEGRLVVGRRGPRVEPYGSHSARNVLFFPRLADKPEDDRMSQLIGEVLGDLVLKALLNPVVHEPSRRHDDDLGPVQGDRLQDEEEPLVPSRRHLRAQSAHRVLPCGLKTNLIHGISKRKLVFHGRRWRRNCRERMGSIHTALEHGSFQAKPFSAVHWHHDNLQGRRSPFVFILDALAG